MSYHPDVMELEDEELVQTLVRIRHHDLFPKVNVLTSWEEAFLQEVPEWWAKTGRISWKQRKVARSVLSKILNVFERHKKLGAWIEEAKAN